MTDCLYITADAVGTQTGGGVVTKNESEALASLGEVYVCAYPRHPRPWGADEAMMDYLVDGDAKQLRPRLAHIYSGTFSKTVALLQKRGCKVTYTAAAHSIWESRAEHERLGVPFDYPHLTDPAQWAEYVRGYLLADVVVCPSELSANIMRGYGCKRVVVIPHGVDLRAVVKPLPKRFAVAALGQLCGPDKGIIYLLQAWKLLNEKMHSFKDATLVIAGYGTERLLPLVRQHGGGNVYLRGEVTDVSEIYDACSVYIQPSVSEGFGIEVLEARAHGRYIICSDGAGARDYADEVVARADARALAGAIMNAEIKHRRGTLELRTEPLSTWPLVRQQYVDLWRSL